MSFSLSPDFFVMWTPEPGRTIEVGPRREPMELPAIPLPLRKEDADREHLSDDQIGEGLFDYLRQFPDCPHAAEYARILQEGFPHYLAEIGSQIVMLDARQVDPLYIRRKIRLLKILLLLEPENPGLLQQIGMAHYQVGTMFSELANCRTDLLRAMNYFQKALGRVEDLTSLNYLAQIDYLLGDYSAAARRWQGVVDRLPQGGARSRLEERLSAIDRDDVPGQPLVDDIERISLAVENYNEQLYDDALAVMREVLDNAYLTALYQPPELFHFYGLCLEKNYDLRTAAEAFQQALEIDADYKPAQEGLERVTG
jgi:tetratricopeptide (TPR) repeat protein